MFISKLSKLGFSYAVAAGMSCAAHGASTYDVVRDFNIRANPNGVWSYQDTTNLAYAHHQYQGVRRLDNWSDDANSPNTVTIVRNKTGAPVSLFDQEMTLPPNYLALESGNGSQGDSANIVFTAPSTGNYTITGDFRGLDHREAGDTHVYVIEDGTQYLWGGNAKPYRLKFNLNAALAAGDTITFQVEDNYRTHARHDVGLTAKITGP
jgi:hypothetical protein